MLLHRFYRRTSSDARGSVYGPGPLPGTCGGLSYDVLEPEPRTCTGDFCTSRNAELKEEAKQWREWACCTSIQAETAIEEAKSEADAFLTAYNKHVTADESLSGYCYYGFAEGRRCPRVLVWLRVAMACDARIPRNQLDQIATDEGVY